MYLSSSLPPHRSFLSRLRTAPLLIALGCGLLLLAGRPARADVTLTLDAKNGDKISDIYTLVARANSPDGIDKVEFRIDDQLRYTDTSVPYSYDWDTLADTEGPHNVSVTAFDSQGKSQRVTLSLVIDNELNLGASALAAKAEEALQSKDSEAALRYSRRALKADPTDLEANRVLASIYASRQDWNKAIAALEKAKIPDDATDMRMQLAAYRMQRALLPENAANFVTDYQAITELRHKVADIAVEKAQAQNTEDKPEAHIAVGDALLNAGHYHEAAVEYSKCGDPETSPVACTNRLALAYVFEGRTSNALPLLRTLKRQNRDDAATHAIEGLILLRAHQFKEALAAVQPDIAGRAPGALVIAAFANTALGNTQAAQTSAKAAAELVPESGDTQYALAVASSDAREAVPALHRALALAPFRSGPVLDYAARLVLIKNPSRDRIDQALNVTDMVLKNEPDNISAQLLEALLYLQSDRVDEVKPILEAVLKQDSTGTDALLTGVAYERAKDNTAGINQFLNAVRKQEPDRYPDLGRMRQPLTFLQYIYAQAHYRPGAFLTVATLFPTTKD
jgi:tetratricopeptide (TPR) repeat protein